MNRWFLTITGCLLLSTTSIAQTKITAALSPSNKSRYKVIYPAAENSEQTAPLPFSAIEIRDIRPDTTKLGFYRSSKDRRSYKYRFTTNTADELTAFLNSHFKNNLTPTSDDKLVIYVKSYGCLNLILQN
jgi:hypothetical protein